MIVKMSLTKLNVIIRELLYNSRVWVTLASREVSKWVRRFPRNVFGHLYFPLSIDGFFYLKFGRSANVLSDGLSLSKPIISKPCNPIHCLPLFPLNFRFLLHPSKPVQLQMNRFIKRALSAIQTGINVCHSDGLCWCRLFNITLAEFSVCTFPYQVD